MADRRLCLLLLAVFFLATGSVEARAAKPGKGKTSLIDSRAAFVSLIKEGQLVAFDDGSGTVTFRPIRPADNPHQPGPMEDEVMASAVRAAAAEDGELHGLKVAVECQGGSLKVSAGASATPVQTAELIKLALNEAGARQVSACLPKA